jgi:cobalt-zinc-cadmium efflux system outer membrane protein
MYGFVPRDGDMYDASLALNLPWLNPGRAARRREADRLTAAAEDAALALADSVAYDVSAAVAGAEAARKAAAATRDEILQRASQALERARRAYENNTAGFLDLIDAERMLRDEQIEYFRTLARYQEAVADLKRAVGR